MLVICGGLFKATCETIALIAGYLPVVVDLSLYDRDPGEHDLTLFATSMFGDTANSSLSFSVSGINYFYCTPTCMLSPSLLHIFPTH